MPMVPVALPEGHTYFITIKSVSFRRRAMVPALKRFDLHSCYLNAWSHNLLIATYVRSLDAFRISVDMYTSN